jgi:hypothetical protein
MFDNAVNIILQKYFSINKIFIKEIFNQSTPFPPAVLMMGNGR